MTSPSTSPNDPGALRARRLQAAVRWSARWLILQGALYCLMGQWLCERVGLRWQDLMVPYVRQDGVTLLALGLFVNAGLKGPRHQAMAVDTLILCLLAQGYFTLSYRLGEHSINAWEWAGLAVNLGLGSALTLFRTRSGEVDPDSAGPLLSLPLPLLAQLKKGALTRAGEGSRQPPPALPESPPPPSPPPGEAKAPPKRSEALPRLDD